MEVTANDIGRSVTYHGNFGGPLEHGVITSYNDLFVFVRYGADMNSKATNREDLTYD